MDWFDSGFIACSAAGNRFIRNVAQGGSGGALCVESSTAIGVLVTFESNRAALTGGAVVGSETSSVSFLQSKFLNNSALVSGGAVFIVASSSLFSDVVGENNSAVENGGFIALALGNMEMLNTRLDRNVASKGGAIACEAFSGASVGRVVGISFGMSNNSATCGGAVYSSECSLDLKSGSLASNKAALSNRYSYGDCSGGGAVAALGGGVFTLSSVQIIENQALSGDGGGLFLSPTAFSSELQFSAITFSRNRADGGGGSLEIIGFCFSLMQNVRWCRVLVSPQIPRRLQPTSLVPVPWLHLQRQCGSVWAINSISPFENGGRGFSSTAARAD